MKIPFLTATWKNLIVVNYEVAPEALSARLPDGVELDLFQGRALISVVAFHFRDMRVAGIIPAFSARHFEEINLRFYVKRRIGDEWRRGVVFVREIVPSRIVACVARFLYDEPYSRLPMRHDASAFDDTLGGTLSYSINSEPTPVTIQATTTGELLSLSDHSVESFILEHYWGYTRRRTGETSEYRVAHPAWKFWRIKALSVSSELPLLYPSEFAEALSRSPHSLCVAQGSDVSVYGYRAFRGRQS
ncbi:MAG: hypothetical protein RL326_1360 [Pseudomonadota bacterium]|jgi:uncharacterized protein YqjF (DUF2071 family)